jgi:hypothetical protein
MSSSLSKPNSTLCIPGGNLVFFFKGICLPQLIGVCICLLGPVFSLNFSFLFEDFFVSSLGSLTVLAFIGSPDSLLLISESMSSVGTALSGEGGGGLGGAASALGGVDGEGFGGATWDVFSSCSPVGAVLSGEGGADF